MTEQLLRCFRRPAPGNVVRRSYENALLVATDLNCNHIALQCMSKSNPGIKPLTHHIHKAIVNRKLNGQLRVQSAEII